MKQTFYSFRRCPYAIRARLAIAYSQQPVQLREVVLKNKPQVMLDLSAKGTVPILQLNNHTVLAESLDIMVWALEQADPDGWLKQDLTAMLALIDENDFEFKKHLDKYKYAPNSSSKIINQEREKAEEFLFKLESKLIRSRYLFGANISLADIAIFPFIRQFAGVNPKQFSTSHFTYLQQWLTSFEQSPLFKRVMKKYPAWSDSGTEFLFPS